MAQPLNKDFVAASLKRTVHLFSFKRLYVRSFFFVVFFSFSFVNEFCWETTV